MLVARRGPTEPGAGAASGPPGPPKYMAPGGSLFEMQQPVVSPMYFRSRGRRLIVSQKAVGRGRHGTCLWKNGDALSGRC